ncbi:MAG: hypothetical protein ACOYOU_01685 [Kiritimatiellia bacterium]
MKQPHTFMSAMIASTCLFLAGGLVVGSGVLEGNPDVRPLARSLGVATVNDCRVRGRIEGRTNGVFAVFDFENPVKEAKEVRFCYLTTCTPPMSLMSRMGPMPQIVKTGVVTRLVHEGSTSEEVLLKEAVPAPAGDLLAAEKLVVSSTNAAVKIRMEMQPETWSLVVSRETIKGVHGWGAVGPAAADGIIRLDKGEAVLASTIAEAKLR